jgi:tRNA dimethylallyltransferase
MPDSINLLVILGPTASGKTRLGVELARQFGGEIISADSRQVYRGLDIGTGKDLHEYGDVPVHLIDIVEPGYEFNVFEYQQHFFSTFAAIRRRRHLPVMVGGSGLYLDAVLNGYRFVAAQENTHLRRELAGLTTVELADRLRTIRPNLHNTTDLHDRTRLLRAIEIAEQRHESFPMDGPVINPLVIGIRWERNVLRTRITNRLKERLDQGMFEETEGLVKKGVSLATLDFYGLEYRYLAKFLQGELNRNDMFQKLNAAIHDYAKRQETWFRRMERQGTVIHWLDGAGDMNVEAGNLVRTYL